jgi:hypothetical protein
VTCPLAIVELILDIEQQLIPARRETCVSLDVIITKNYATFTRNITAHAHNALWRRTVSISYFSYICTHTPIEFVTSERAA